MNEKLEKVLREMKNNRRTQSVPTRKYREQNTPQVGTSTNTNSEGDEINASDSENQENEIQDSPFRPSVINELRTSIQSLGTQNVDLNDSLVINEHRIGDDYHTYQK